MLSTAWSTVERLLSLALASQSECLNLTGSLLGSVSLLGALQAHWSLQAVGSSKRTKGGMPVITATWSSSSMTTWLAEPQQESQSGSNCRRHCLWQMPYCKQHSDSLLRSCRLPPRRGHMSSCVHPAALACVYEVCSLRPFVSSQCCCIVFD